MTLQKQSRIHISTKVYFIVFQVLALICVFIGQYIFYINNSSYGRVFIRFLYTSSLLFLLFKSIGREGFLKYKWLILCILIDTIIVFLFAFPENPIAIISGSYLSVISKCLLFLQIYKFKSYRDEKPTFSIIINFIIVIIVIGLCYFLIIDQIYSTVIAAVIMNMGVLSIILGLAILLDTDIRSKILFASGTFGFLFSILFAAYYFFTPNPLLKFNLSNYTNLFSYFIFTMAIYYNFKQRKNLDLQEPSIKKEAQFLLKLKIMPNLDIKLCGFSKKKAHFL